MNKHLLRLAILSCVLCLMSIVTQAQIKGEYILNPAISGNYHDMLKLHDGNMITVGAFPSNDIYILKINSGTLHPEWQIKLTLHQCAFRQITELKNHTIVVLAYFRDTLLSNQSFIAGIVRRVIYSSAKY